MCINFPHRIRTFCPCERSQLYDVWLQNCFFSGFFVWCAIISQEISLQVEDDEDEKAWIVHREHILNVCVRVRFDRAPFSCVQFQFRYLAPTTADTLLTTSTSILQTIQTTTNNINISSQFVPHQRPDCCWRTHSKRTKKYSIRNFYGYEMTFGIYYTSNIIMYFVFGKEKKK